MATLSQQLTWSHFVELLPIEDELKRNFYASMCKNENWSVRVLRERKKSMLYERTAISKMPEETIANDIAELRDNGKMTLEKKLSMAIANAKEQLEQRKKDS